MKTARVKGQPCVTVVVMPVFALANASITLDADEDATWLFPQRIAHSVLFITLTSRPRFHHTLVQDGRCWWYRKYAPEDTVLEGLEAEAREARKDLWADPVPVAPWEWRKRK